MVEIHYDLLEGNIFWKGEPDGHHIITMNYSIDVTVRVYLCIPRILVVVQWFNSPFRMTG